MAAVEWFDLSEEGHDGKRDVDMEDAIPTSTPSDPRRAPGLTEKDEVGQPTSVGTGGECVDVQDGSDDFFPFGVEQRCLQRMTHQTTRGSSRRGFKKP